MILIIGGAYQGKRDYARKKWALSSEEIFTCRDAQVDFRFPCVDEIQEFTWACTEMDRDPRAYFEANEDQWRDSILICRDIFSGVVPLGAREREWRQETGLLCQYLAEKAEHVVRIFCGLEQVLK